VLFLIHNLDVGGAQRAMVTLASEVADAGWRAVVCPWRRSGPLEHVLSEAGVPVAVPRTHGGWSRREVPGFLMSVVRRTGASVIHAHMSDAAICAAGLNVPTRVPFLVTHHSPDVLDLGGQATRVTRTVRVPLLRWAVGRAASNVAVSDEVARAVAERTGLDHGRIRVIPNGIRLPASTRVDEANRRRGDRAAARFAGGGPTIVATSRLAHEKGLDTLVAAIAVLKTEFPGVRAILAGAGAEEAALRGQTSRLGLDAHIEFPGVVDDVPALLDDADVFASPSRLEGMPLAVLEAMASGVPVVASRVAGHASLLGKDRYGLLFDAEQPDALAAAIARTLLHPAESAARAAGARRQVAAHHGAATMSASYVELYRTVLTTPRP
jgi:glycosyltransferase involved in cell wall biosynthesis